MPRRYRGARRTSLGALPAVLLILITAGCASLYTSRMADSLSAAMMAQNDPEIVRAGAPAYLLLIDSLIEDAPNDRRLLRSGAELYAAYAGAFAAEAKQRNRLTERAFDYARRAFCLRYARLCPMLDRPYPEFADALQDANPRDLETLFVLGTTWAAWIQARSEDWNALAQLPKAELLLQRIVDQDPGFRQGRAQLYLAVMRSQIPPALGGNPELGREHFELAIRYSDGRDLIVQVEFARQYARLVFDQELHDRLLREVLAADPNQPGLTLSNVLAQEQARELLDEEYF